MSDSGARPSADPLFETLFRGTPGTVPISSAAPIPTIGTHSRAGNAMGRTRAALLSGAAKAVTATGTKITMSQVATYSGVAKATLYNHFRTRDAVLAALLAHEIDELVNRIDQAPLERALVETATEISQHPLVRALAIAEPATVAKLSRVDPRVEGWRRADECVQAALARDGLGGANLVLRWLASYLMTPGSAESIVEDARIVAAGLPALSTLTAGAVGTLSAGASTGEELDVAREPRSA